VGLRGSAGGEEPSGGNALRLIQIRLATASFEKSRQRVKPICREHESPIPVPQKQSTFHPYGQRNTFVIGTSWKYFDSE